MRPDTEPNKHAKRIMAGAFVLSVSLGTVHGAVWLWVNYTTVAIAIGWIASTAIICHILGTIALDVYGNISDP